MTEALGESVGGWKCGAPAPDKGECRADLRSLIYRQSSIPIKGAVARVEQEIAFVIGRELPPRSTPYSFEEVCRPVAETRLVLELIGSRYLPGANAGYLEMLADNLSNEGLFVGPRVALAPADPVLAGFPSWWRAPRGFSSSARGAIRTAIPPCRCTGWRTFWRTAAPGLQAGQIVTTGAYAGALEMPLNTPLRILFGGLGDIACELVR